MEENRIPEMAMLYKQSCKKKREQPKRTWFDGIREAMKKRGIEEEWKQSKMQGNFRKQKATSDAKNHRQIENIIYLNFSYIPVKSMYYMITILSTKSNPFILKKYPNFIPILDIFRK